MVAVKAYVLVTTLVAVTKRLRKQLKKGSGFGGSQLLDMIHHKGGGSWQQEREAVSHVVCLCVYVHYIRMHIRVCVCVCAWVHMCVHAHLFVFMHLNVE